MRFDTEKISRKTGTNLETISRSSVCRAIGGSKGNITYRFDTQSQREGTTINTTTIAWGVYTKMCAMVAFASICCHNRIAFGTESTKSEALALLKKCLETQAKTDKISMEVEAEMCFTTNDQAPRRQHDKRRMKRNDELLDVVGEYKFIDKMQEQSYRYRAVINEKISIYYTTDINNPKTPMRGFASKDKRKQFTRHAITTPGGLVLDGLTGYSGEGRLSEAMAQAEDVQLAGSDSINGVVCQIVRAATKRGVITQWIAPSLGYTVLRVHHTKDENDLLEEKPLREQPAFHAWPKEVFRKKWFMEIDKVKIGKLGDDYVPESGEVAVTVTFSDGTSNLVKYIIQRKDIKLGPAFRGADDFVTDLPEGALLTNGDDKKSGITYEFRNGDMVVRIPESMPQTLPLKPQVGYSTMNWLIGVIVMGVISILVVYLFLRFQSAGRDREVSG